MATDKTKTEETKSAAFELPAALDMKAAETHAGKDKASEFYREVVKAGGFGTVSDLLVGDLDLKGLQIAADDANNKNRQLSQSALKEVRAAFEKYKG